MKLKFVKMVASLFITGSFLIIAFGSGEDKKSNCDTSSKDYRDGFEIGKLAWSVTRFYNPDGDRKAFSHPENIPCWEAGYEAGWKSK